MVGRLLSLFFAIQIMLLLTCDKVLSGLPHYGGGCSFNGVQLLREWLTKCLPVSYRGVQKISLRQDNMADELQWKWHIWRSATGKVRIEFIEPQMARGTIVISDGQVAWHIFAGGKVALQLRDIPRAPWEINAEQLDLLLQNYRVSVVGKDKVLERRCHIILFEPRHNFNPSQKVWLDSGIYIPLRVENYNPNGNLAWRMEYEEFAVDEKIPHSLFQPSLPKGCKVIQQRFVRKGPFKLVELPSNLKFAPLIPKSPPPGYAFDRAFVIELRQRQGEQTLQLIYTNGLSVISVFERKVMGEEGMGERCRFKVGRFGFPVPQNVVRRVVGNVEVVLISRISRDVLEQMARSVAAQ